MNGLTRGEEYSRRQAAGESWRVIGIAEGLSKETVRVKAYDWRRSHPEWKAQAEQPEPEVKQAHAAPVFDTPFPAELSLEEFVDLARRNQRAVNSVDPILTTEKITLDCDAPAAVIFTSCYHLGSRYVQHEAFERLLTEALGVDRLYWIALGDETEGMAGFFDVGSASEQALADPKVQRAMLARVLDKLVGAGKLLAGFASQHGSDWVRRKVGEDPIKALYMARRIPYFDGQAYIHLTVGKEMYRLFGAHQLPGHSMYNKNHAQKRAALFKAPSADVIFMGDKHSTSIQRTALDTWETLAGERPSAEQILLQVGTSKTGPDPYTIKTWSPGYWNWPILVFRHDRHEIIDGGRLDTARLLLEHWN